MKINKEKIIIILVIMLIISMYFNFSNYISKTRTKNEYYDFTKINLLHIHYNINYIIKNKDNPGVSDVIKECSYNFDNLDKFFQDGRRFIPGIGNYPGVHGTLRDLSYIFDEGSHSEDFPQLLEDGAIDDSEIEFLETLSTALEKLISALEKGDIKKYNAEVERFNIEWYLNEVRYDSEKSPFDLLR